MREEPVRSLDFINGFMIRMHLLTRHSSLDHKQLKERNSKEKQSPIFYSYAPHTAFLFQNILLDIFGTNIYSMGISLPSHSLRDTALHRSDHE